MSNNYGITQTGFNPKPLDVIESELIENIQQNFGESIDVSAQSSMFKMLRVQAVEASILWLKAEDNFYSQFIQSARDAALDLLGEDVGLPRKPAVKSGVELTIYKNTTAAVTVPQYSLFQTLEGVVFLTDEEIIIAVGDPSVEIGVVDATAAVAGVSGNVGSSTIIQPTNTIAGIDSSINLVAAFGGENRESDDVYRLRLGEYIKSTWTPQAIRSAVLNIDGVAGVKIIEHATSYDVLVVPQVTFTPTLQSEIEAAIYLVNPITVEYFVLEAKTVLINVDGTITISGIDIFTANSEASLSISNYLSGLNIDDDVYKSKITQAIVGVIGINNVYNLNLSGLVSNEKHIFITGTSEYNLGYSSAVFIETVNGILGGSPHTFVVNVDYQFVSGPPRIQWLGADEPDNNTEFIIAYKIDPNVIGDILINQDSVAKIGGVNLTT